MSVSVVVPICNELENIPLLYQQLDAVLPSLERPWEIVFVDDGSTDGSSERLKELAARDAAREGRPLPPQLRPDGGDARRDPACRRAT